MHLGVDSSIFVWVYHNRTMTQLNTTNPFALRYLLDDLLFDFEADFPAATEQSPNIDRPTFNVLGANKSRILYLVENMTEGHFSPAALDAFTKTLHALGLALDDVAVLNLAQIEAGVNFEDLCSYFDPQRIIFAGPSPAKVGIDGLSLNVASSQQSIELLYTYSFEEMLTDTNKKKLFWQAVKAF